VNTPAPLLLRRCLTLVLAALLALGPFLHSHFGASHETGFHLDGVHAVHASADVGNAKATPQASAWQADDEESLALGVATSRPHPENDGWPLLAWALLLAVLPLLPPVRQALPCARPAQRSPHTRYRAGLPPPGLAPPTH